MNIFVLGRRRSPLQETNAQSSSSSLVDITKWLSVTEMEYDQNNRKISRLVITLFHGSHFFFPRFQVTRKLYFSSGEHLFTIKVRLYSNLNLVSVKSTRARIILLVKKTKIPRRSALITVNQFLSSINIYPPKWLEKIVQYSKAFPTFYRIKFWPR